MKGNGEEKGGPRPARGHGVRYPWGRWFGRGRVVLYAGIDYHCHVTGMIANVRRAAARHGLVVSVRAGADCLTVEVRGWRPCGPSRR